MTDTRITIARIDTCDTPSHIVGFAITHQPSGKSVYLDSFVPLDGAPSSQDAIVKLAYENIKSNVDAFVRECDSTQKSIVGKTFDPTTSEIA